MPVDVGSRRRNALVHAPEKIESEASVPLLLVFHGGRGGPEAIARLAAFDAIADGGGLISVYPQALTSNWSDGRLTTRPQNEEDEDVPFVRKLVEELCNRYPVDRTRIFAAGMSNGGMMCHRLGIQMPETFAAIAAVAGGMPEEITPPSTIAKPISVIGIYGTADPIIPWEGGPVGRGAGGRVLGARATTDLWAHLLDCPAEGTTENLPPLEDDGTRVWRETYARSDGRARVVLYGVEGGGHGWPPRGIGRTGLIARSLTGKASRNLDTTGTIWAFFKESVAGGPHPAAADGRSDSPTKPVAGL